MPLESFWTNELQPPLMRAVEEFLDSQRTAHPFQFPQWADPGSRLVLLREGEKVIWAGTFAILACFGKKFPWIRAAVANRGPVCDDLTRWLQCAEDLPEIFSKERISYVEVSPDWVRSAEGEPARLIAASNWQSLNAERVSLRLDLTASEDRIFSNFRKVSRYEIRRAERLGATVCSATSDAEIDEFLRLHRDLGARKGFAVDEMERMRRQIRWIVNTESRGALLLARTENIVRGGVVIVRAAQRCWYVWGATDTKQQLNVGHVLQWRALQWAKAHGCTEYDFGGYTPGATSGPAWFKAGFGGREVYFVPPFRKVVRPGRYRLYSLISRMRSR